MEQRKQYRPYCSSPSAGDYCYRCGNVAAILELDEHLNRSYKTFEAAPADAREPPPKNPVMEYFL